MKLSIIIPVYNEGSILKKNIETIEKFFKNKFKFEIIVIDDGSTDNSLSILNAIKSKNFKLLSNQINSGKGYSIKRGINESTGEIILTTDADLSAPIGEFNKLYKKYSEKIPFVIGSRNKSNSVLNYKQNYSRDILGKIFNYLTKLILNLNYRDTQCGFKLYNSNKIKSIIKLCDVNRFCIDVEILYLASLKSIQVFEEGIEWNYNTKSTVKLLIDPLNMFIDLVKIRLKKY